MSLQAGQLDELPAVPGSGIDDLPWPAQPLIVAAGVRDQLKGELRRSRASRHDPLWREIPRHRRLTRTEESRLLGQFDPGVRSPGRDELVLSNLRLVVRLALKHRHRGIELDDLMQEGVRGLLKAADRYEPDRGVRFAEYAIWWIRRRIQLATAVRPQVVRLPPHCYEHVLHIRQFQTEFLRDNWIPPSDGDVREHFKLTDEQLVWSLRMIAATECRPLSAASEKCAPDPSPASAFFAKADRAVVRRAIRQTLDDRLAQIVRRRFGIGGARRQTLARIARDMCVTRERIRQLESIALRRLAFALRNLIGEPHWHVPPERERLPKLRAIK